MSEHGHDDDAPTSAERLVAPSELPEAVAPSALPSAAEHGRGPDDLPSSGVFPKVSKKPSPPPARWVCGVPCCDTVFGDVHLKKSDRDEDRCPKCGEGDVFDLNDPNFVYARCCVCDATDLDPDHGPEKCPYCGDNVWCQVTFEKMKESFERRWHPEKFNP